MTDYENSLHKTLSVLRDRPLTARQLARRLKVCKPTAYERLRALIARGDVRSAERVRDGATGPTALTYTANL